MKTITDSEVQVEGYRVASIMVNGLTDVTERLALTSKEVGERAGVSPTLLQEIEDGEADLPLDLFVRFGLACDTRWMIVGLKSDDCSVVTYCPPSVREAILEEAHKGTYLCIKGWISIVVLIFASYGVASLFI